MVNPRQKVPSSVTLSSHLNLRLEHHVAIYPALVTHLKEILLFTRKTNCKMSHLVCWISSSYLGLWMLELLMSRELFEESHASFVGKLF